MFDMVKNLQRKLDSSIRMQAHSLGRKLFFIENKS